MKTYLEILLSQQRMPTHANGYFPLRRPTGFLSEGLKPRKTRASRRGRPAVSER
jgi:hypothetical protein